LRLRRFHLVAHGASLSPLEGGALLQGNRLLVGTARCLRLIPVQEVAQFHQRLDLARIGLLPVERRDDRGRLRRPRRISLENLEHLALQLVQCCPAIGVARQAGQHVRDAPTASEPEGQA